MEPLSAAGIGAPAYAVPERSGGMSRARRRSADSAFFEKRSGAKSRPVYSAFKNSGKMYNDYMEEKRKVITVRVDPQLKFEIEKTSVAEGYPTVNSWIIKVIKQYLEGVKK